MRFLKFLLGSTLLLLTIMYQGEVVYRKHTSAADKPQLLDVISAEDLAMMIGGCSGADCESYDPSCPDNCSSFGADQCQSGSGNCVDNCRVMICSCPSYYDFIFGCL